MKRKQKRFGLNYVKKWAEKVDCITDTNNKNVALKRFSKLYYNDIGGLVDLAIDYYDKEDEKFLKKMLTPAAIDYIQYHLYYYKYGCIRKELYETYNVDYDTCYFDLQ